MVTSNNNSLKKQYKELILYDGFMIQRLFEAMINENEANIDHVHIVFEDRLICIFSEEDWRYHARTILGGTLQLFLRQVLLKHLPNQKSGT